MLEYGLSPETEDGQAGFKLTPSSFIVSKNFQSSTQGVDLSSLSLTSIQPSYMLITKV